MDEEKDIMTTFKGLPIFTEQHAMTFDSAFPIHLEAKWESIEQPRPMDLTATAKMPWYIGGLRIDSFSDWRATSVERPDEKTMTMRGSGYHVSTTYTTPLMLLVKLWRWARGLW